VGFGLAQTAVAGARAVACSLAVGAACAGLAAPVALADSAPLNVSPPTFSGLAIQGQTLTASSGSWAGTTPFAFAYQWERCNQSGVACTSIASATGQTYQVVAADVGNTLRVQVSASNTAGSAQMLSAATSTVAAPSAPANTSAPTLSGSAQLAQTLTVSAGSWSGEPAPTYTYQWQRCDSAGANCTNIAGANGQSYTTAATDVGGRLQAIVTATNSAGSASSASEQTVAVTSPPSETAVPTVSGSPIVNQALAASNGSWSGLPAPTFSYQWQRCDSAGANCTNIAGATAQSYLLTSSDVTRRLRVVVAAANSLGSAGGTSSPTAVIGAALAPSNTSHPTISGSRVLGQTLSAGPGTWTGTAPISYAYQWQLCTSSGTRCTNISGASGQTYLLVAGNFDRRLQVLVTASNPSGTGSHLSEQTSLIGSVPVSTGQPRIVGTPLAGHTLSLGAGVWIGSAPISYGYQWQRCDSSGSNCQNVPGATTIHYPLRADDVGAIIQAVVTAQNYLGTASRATPPTAPVAGHAKPALIAPPAILGLPRNGNLLELNTITAAGFPTPTLGYQWQRCTRNATGCFDLHGTTTSRYRIRSGDVGHTLRALVTATNSAGQTVVPTGPTLVVESATSRLVLATRVVGLRPRPIRLTLIELRGPVNLSLWLELDASHQRYWRPITKILIAFGARATIDILRFQVHPRQNIATISIRWRASSSNQVTTSSYLASQSSLLPRNLRQG